MIDPTIFKAYDIRGTVPDQINEEVFRQIGRAYARWMQDRRQKTEDRRQIKIAVGRDVRLHSKGLTDALIQGIISQGADVVDIGLISTPMLYFISGSTDTNGGLGVTASHNPAEYNGLKLVREKAIAISGDSGIKEIAALAGQPLADTETPGNLLTEDYTDRYLARLKTLVNVQELKTKKIVVNSNFGFTSTLLKKLAADLSVELIYLNDTLDGSFPKGKPDPLLPENRRQTSKLVKSSQADFGAAWDADGDRVFFFDENGEFIDGYFGTAILAEAMLLAHPGAKIILDARLTWAIVETVIKNGGIPLINKCGHAFFKERMRAEDAVFAGEMSGHYYFRDSFYADDGLLAFLTIWQLLSKKNCQFSDLVKNLRASYKTPGEINFQVENLQQLIAAIEQKYPNGEKSKVDGLSIEYADWRFNLRPSNTEPLVRLNIESRSSSVLDTKLQELIEQIESLGGRRE